MRVEIYRDRACTNLVSSFDAPGSSGGPMIDLPIGVNYWRIRGRQGSASNFVTAWSEVWQFIVPRREGTMAPDSSYAGSLDVNGDGFTDLLVGADGAGLMHGQAFVYLGSASGLSNIPNATLRAASASDSLFGSVVANLGDVNGDGFGDVGVVALSSSRVYVFHGRSSGSLDPMAAARFNPAPGAVALGMSLAGVGDVNGDGYADVLVGVPGTAEAYLFFGSAGGVTATGVLRFAGNATSLYGASVAGPGDLNGDGLADFTVGAPNEGFIYVYLSSAGSPVTMATSAVVLTGGSRAGVAMAAAGDVNADGFADIIVGEGDAATVGQARVWRGNSSTGIERVAPAPMTAPGNQGFGTAVSGNCDIDGDGFTDLVIGAQMSSRALVFRGSASGAMAAALYTINGTAGQGAGIAVACLYDSDANSTGEVTVATNNPPGLRVYRSAPGMSFPTGDVAINAPSVLGTAAGNFGASLGY